LRESDVSSLDRAVGEEQAADVLRTRATVSTARSRGWIKEASLAQLASATHSLTRMVLTPLGDPH